MSWAGGFADRLELLSQRQRWRDDPVVWAAERLGEHCWSKQAEVMRSVQEQPLVAVQSGHGVGKSHLASRLVLWFLDTRPVTDTFVVTTAPTSAQVRAILWRYIRQGHERAGMPGRVSQVAEWKIDGHLVAYGRRPADHSDSAFQGIHAKHLLVVLDEAGGIPKALWDAADSLATGADSHILAIGNPDNNSSHFAKVCTTEPGWTRHKISAFDSPNLTGEPVPQQLRDVLVTREWVEDKLLRWGEHSPLYTVKVLGEFVDAEDGLIPLSWVRAAHARWHAWQERREASPVRIEPPGGRVLGVDVARFGEDKTAILPRQGDVVNPDGEPEIERHAREDTTQTTSRVAAHLRARPGSRAVVDVVGVGAGVYDQLVRAELAASAFNGAAGTKRRDATGEWRFPNVRSASYWNLRELLDPARNPTLALPEDDDLTADLTAPRWEVRAGGLIVVESKDDIRKRLGHSPDAGDALAMACWVDPPPGPGDTDSQVHEHADRWQSPLHPGLDDPRVDDPLGDPRHDRFLGQTARALARDPATEVLDGGNFDHLATDGDDWL